MTGQTVTDVARSLGLPTRGSLGFDRPDDTIPVVLDGVTVFGRVLSPQELAASYLPGSGIAFVSFGSADWAPEPDTPDPVVVDVPALPRLFADVGELLVALAEG